MRWYALGVSLTTFLITVGAYLNGYDPDIAGLPITKAAPTRQTPIAILRYLAAFQPAYSLTLVQRS